MDRKKLAKEAPKFDGKKNVWVTDKKEGFIKGEILSTKGEEVQIQLTESRLVRTEVANSRPFHLERLKTCVIVGTCTTNMHHELNTPLA